MIRPSTQETKRKFMLVVGLPANDWVIGIATQEDKETCSK